MSPLWTRAEAVEATGGEATGAWDALTGVSIDSRTTGRGELFVALKDRRDGHAFAAQALEAGAGAALVSRRPDGVAEDAPLLVVDDPLAALERLGAAARARTKAGVVAVTGSVGKTSTKEMLRTMLGCQGRTHAAEKSYNNHWGVPLTLARMPRDTEYAVIEMGMNHAGEIAPLSRLARPHVALITTVEAVHLENFESVEEIADAKAEVFAGLEPGGTAVLNRDNPHFARLADAAGEARVIGFGSDEASDYRLLDAVAGVDATVVRADTGGSVQSFRIGAPGVHMALNALGALAAVAALKADRVRAALALSDWVPPEGRGARWTVRIGPAGIDGEIVLIDESYNANPVSMRAALAVLAAAPVTDGMGRVRRGRRLAVLGDMLELGRTEDELHASLACAPELEAVDCVYTAGPRMRHLHEVLPREKRGEWFEDSEKLAERARRTVDAGDVCMVKGSLGSAMARVVEQIKSLGEAEDARTGAKE
ncbi:MAG TPA: UDP-N-acetylmuramoylalanyl-D-glutamyl-2,6-diaminopimelate--D-alanyl-D-alanine ligase [Thermohalobaculum sp.]|nr:UDP-N-acetylmuramoylalanyl-D-glutamyl-2,6-diaminopimelate--D-alanyl-D-alanine ligase [Thermohalobaculum sp.]